MAKRKQISSCSYLDLSLLSKARFLLKSEPAEFGIDHFFDKPDFTTVWDGIRNGQARNFMKQMKVGDFAYFYHSNHGKLTGIAGLVEVVKAPYPDPAADDPCSKYFDSNSQKYIEKMNLKNCSPSVSEPPPSKWYAMEIRLVGKLPKPLLLTEMQLHFNINISKRNLSKSSSPPLVHNVLSSNETRIGSEMLLFKISRLSVQPVSTEQSLSIEALYNSLHGSVRKLALGGDGLDPAIPHETGTAYKTKEKEEIETPSKKK